jgi:exodeoxyribonuclease VII small subunit
LPPVAEVKPVAQLTLWTALRRVPPSAPHRLAGVSEESGPCGVATSDDNEAAVDFEAAMGELEALVERMEQGECSLEESIRQFERGVRLARTCQQALRAAEQKVLKLAAEGSEEALQEFRLPDEA